MKIVKTGALVCPEKYFENVPISLYLSGTAMQFKSSRDRMAFVSMRKAKSKKRKPESHHR